MSGGHAMATGSVLKPTSASRHKGYKTRKLNDHEKAIEANWNHDAVAVETAALSWLKDVTVGLTILQDRMDGLTQGVKDVISSNAERQTSPATVVEEIRDFFQKNNLLD